MGKVRFEIVEHTFNKRKIASCELSILLGMDSLVFMLVDAAGIQLIKDYQYDSRDWEELEGIFEGEKLLSERYLRVKTAFLSPQQTLVPEPLYQEDKDRIYLEHLTDLSNDAQLDTDYLPEVEAYSVYAYPHAWKEILEHHYEQYAVFHISTPLIRTSREKIKGQPADGTSHMHIHVFDRLLQVLLWREDQLCFVNTFPFGSARDFVYYVLLVIDQYDLDQSETSVVVSGRIIKDSEVYQLLGRYLENINFASAPGQPVMGQQLKIFPAHFYWDMLALGRTETS
ncbi:MAG: DUF3822 family protein [Saprospiraceae bacterium]|nr:DUF3822 family protein [Saprospiraceae bacterium]